MGRESSHRIQTNSSTHPRLSGEITRQHSCEAGKSANAVAPSAIFDATILRYDRNKRCDKSPGSATPPALLQHAYLGVPEGAGDVESRERQRQMNTIRDYSRARLELEEASSSDRSMVMVQRNDHNFQPEREPLRKTTNGLINTVKLHAILSVGIEDDEPCIACGSRTSSPPCLLCCFKGPTNYANPQQNKTFRFQYFQEPQR